MIKKWDKVFNHEGEWQFIELFWWRWIVLFNSLDIERFSFSQIESVKWWWATKSTDLSEQFKLLWQIPKQSERKPKRWEMVEVRDLDSEKWVSAEFIQEVEDFDGYKYLVKYIYDFPIAFKQVQKPIEQPKQEDIILVPDNIKIESFDWNLAINNWKQSLFYSEGIYKVDEELSQYEVKCKLIPIDVKDLEVGGTYYRKNVMNRDKLNNLFFYCKFLWDSKFAYRDGESVVSEQIIWKHRYKVVPVE